MRVRTWLALAGVATIAGCATPPATVRPPEPPAPIAAAPEPQAPPMVESPPIEPVEAPIVPPTSPTPAPSEPPRTIATPPESESAAPAALPPAEPTEEQQLASLLADLQRYGTLSPDDLRMELNTVTQLLGRQRTDYNRVRLAVLFTLAKTSPQDDQRALQLFDSVAKSNPGSPAVKQLAMVLQAQVAERARAVHDEQVKAEAATKKLEALRSMERDLLRDRLRGGGGGGGGGGSGGGGGGGGGH
jgi:hypothetical protein